MGLLSMFFRRPKIRYDKKKYFNGKPVLSVYYHLTNRKLKRK